MGVPPDYAHVMMHLMHNEPVVAAALRLLQQHCLRSGVTVQHATPSFQRHVQRHYTDFCENAIQAFLAVGFAPFRMITADDGERVPEVLPLGTYSWTVLPQREGKGPLLRYEVRCHYSQDTVYTYAYVPPRLYYKCISPLSTLLDAHSRLLQLRLHLLSACEWNARPNISVESRQGVQMTQAAEQGVALQNGPFSQVLAESMRNAMAKNALQYVQAIRKQANIPEASTLLVPPVNCAVQALPLAQTPQELEAAEIRFTMAVSQCTGIPVTLLSPANRTAEAIGRSAQSAEATRTMLMTCNAMCRHLVRAMELVYHILYPDSKRQPEFILIPDAPLELHPEQLVPLFDAQLLSDADFSTLLQTSLGGELQVGQAHTARKRRLEPPPTKT